MRHITIICLGKLKEKYWREAEAEYLKRLSLFAKVEIIELKEESFGEKDPADMIRKLEAEKILNALGKKQDNYIIALDEHGQQFSSVDFARTLASPALGSAITFIIGGPLGLDESILKIAKLKFSFSALTFTHQMIRVFLLEQIYRSAMITGGRKYHY